MTTPHRTLPPLPVPAITMKHGPWKPSQFDDDETYCAHCLTRSIFAHRRRFSPKYQIVIDAIDAARKGTTPTTPPPSPSPRS